MSRHTRREFLKHSAVAAAAVAAPMVAAGRVLGANDTISLGVAGIGGRGGSHISEFAKMEGVRVTHLIDPDSRFFKQRTKEVERLGKNTPKCFQDLRKALEDKDLDAISIASCNHWHSLMTIWACQHEKDVYVEKPCSHNVFEGRKCVEAARRYKRIVQHGTQGRSSDGWAQQMAAIQSGKYGKLLVSKGYASKAGSGRWSIGFKPIGKPPKDLDYNLWLGPAPEMPYHQNLVHYNWHWFWETGNGEIGNQGVHQMDIARWAITAATGKVGPKSVISVGGRWVEGPGFKDQAQTPNMQLTVMDFDGALLVFEVRGLVGQPGPTGKTVRGRVDNEFYLEEGVIRGGKFYPKGKDEPETLVAAKGKDKRRRNDNHFANFIDCVRSRKQENLCAEILEGHLSAALGHVGNISFRVGQDVPFSQKPDLLGSDPRAVESFEAIKSNLTTVLGMNLDEHTYRLGAKLTYDADAEKFVGNEEANKLLTRPYRKPFVVPETV